MSRRQYHCGVKDQTIKQSRESDKFMLRLPDGMRAQISVAADAAGRSMNAEIVARLARSFQDELGEAEQLRIENATLKQMLEGRTLGTDLAAVLAVTLASQTLGMVESVKKGKPSPREIDALGQFAELVLDKQPRDWPTELLKAYETTPSDAAGAKAKRELEVLRRIGQSLVTYYEATSTGKRLAELYDERRASQAKTGKL